MIVSPISVQKYNIKFKQNKKSELTEHNKSYTSVALTGIGVLGAISVAILATKAKSQKPNYSFKNFIEKSRFINLEKPQDIINECTEKNIIGTGANSTVYKFTHPKMQNWAIKVDKKHLQETQSSQEILEIKDEFPNINMGQEIATIGKNIHILKRIHGKPHSIKDWSINRQNKTPISQQEASSFLEDIQKISDFPQESFNNYAKKLKILDENGYKADSFNPNNYLIDYKNKELHIIDAYKYDVDAHMNTKYDLFCPLVDYPNYERFYNVMSPEQKEKYIKTTAIINEKCTKAAEHIGLNNSESTFREFIGRIDSRENNGGMYTNSYNRMLEIIKGTK